MTIDPSTGVRGLEPGRQDLAYASQSCFQERQPHYRAAHFVYLPAIFRFTQPQHNKSDASGGSASRNLFGAAEVEFNRRARSIQTLGIQTLGATGHRCYGSTLIRIKQIDVDPMFCPSCATENQSEQKYCRRCGQPLAGVHLALEGRVDEAIKTLRIGEKTPHVKFILLAAALLLLSITTIHALRTGAPLAFLLMPACGLLLGLLIGLSKRTFKLWHVKRLLNAGVEFKSLTANSVASPGLPIASNSSAAKSPVPVSVTENTTLDLRSPEKGQK